MINIKLIEQKYEELGLKITKIEQRHIDRLKYYLITFEWNFENEAMYYKDVIDECFGVVSYNSEVICVEDSCLVRMDKNISQGILNTINNFKLENKI